MNVIVFTCPPAVTKLIKLDVHGSWNSVNGYHVEQRLTLTTRNFSFWLFSFMFFVRLKTLKWKLKSLSKLHNTTKNPCNF